MAQNFPQLILTSPKDAQGSGVKASSEPGLHSAVQGWASPSAQGRARTLPPTATPGDLGLGGERRQLVKKTFSFSRPLAFITMATLDAQGQS